jgi:hypothetical protein
VKKYIVCPAPSGLDLIGNVADIEIDAEWVEIGRDGAVIFYTSAEFGAPDLVRAFAPNAWLSVREKKA